MDPNGNKPSPISNDIYEILGISPKTIDEPEKTEHREVPASTAADASGMEVLWTHYRVCMILGIIAAVIPFLILLVAYVGDLFGGSSPASTLEYKEYAEYAEPDEGYSEEYTSPVEEAAPAEFLADEYYFQGTINDKYPIHLYLNTANEYGKYYYDRSGADNCMALGNIVIRKNGSTTYEIEMEEFNNDGEITGTWAGTLTSDGTLSGTGEFLGKSMPFSLSVCEPYETDF